MFKFFRRTKRELLVSRLNEQYAANRNALVEGIGFYNKNKYIPPAKESKPYLYILDFHGDIMATDAEGLTKEVSTIINFADKADEVLIRLESAGGAVHSYGYAASQIERLKNAKIKVTVAVDKVAASGGYLMACVANKLIAAPYSIIGSIGVVMEMPNISKILETLGVEYKTYTAGKFKRTVTTMSPITQEGEDKLKEELNTIHDIFKEHIKLNRPFVDVDNVSTGETWLGKRALENKLIDEVKTSEEYILERLSSHELIHIEYIGKGKGGFFSSKINTQIYNFISGFIEHIVKAVLK